MPAPIVELTAEAATFVASGGRDVDSARLAAAAGHAAGAVVALVDPRGDDVGVAIVDPDNQRLRVMLVPDDGFATVSGAVLAWRLERALAWRKALGLPGERATYRLINGAGDGLPGFTCDVLGRYAVLYAYAPALVPWARQLAEAVRGFTGVAGVVVKVRARGGASEVAQEVVGEAPPERYVAEEHGVPVEIHPLGGLNVGLFTDMREERQRLGRFVGGGAVLNLFSYTAMLSVTCARAERIIVEGGHAVGLVARARTGRTLTVRARAVVVACGTLLTPTFLERNHVGTSSGQLGHNLSIHPAAGALAEFDEPIESWRGVPQGLAIEEFAEDGILLEGAATPLEFTAALMPQLGPRLVELCERFDRIASFGLMVEDSSRGRVRLVRGRPVVTYNLGDADVARLRRGLDILARVFFAAGARMVMLPVHGHTEVHGPDDLARFRAASIRASDLDLSAYHPLGTARLGPDPRSSVVAPDHQVHDTPGLYVIDGASVPSSLGVNPQLTIMAMATRAAERLADRLG